MVRVILILFYLSLVLFSCLKSVSGVWLLLMISEVWLWVLIFVFKMLIKFCVNVLVSVLGVLNDRVVNVILFFFFCFVFVLVVIFVSKKIYRVYWFLCICLIWFWWFVWLFLCFKNWVYLCLSLFNFVMMNE